MSATKYKKICSTIFFILCILSIIMSFPTQGYAIDIFFNGEKTTLTDINQPNDTFFGGSNGQPPYTLLGGTDLTLTTQNFAQNVIDAAYGGSFAQNNSVVINGDVHLTINNTFANNIIGGNLSTGGGDTSILGSVYLNISNSTVTGSVNGAGVNNNDGSLITGSLNMYLNNVTCGDSIYAIHDIDEGLGKQGAVVNGDINITIENSTVARDISIGSDDHTIPIIGNATLTLINTTVNGNISGVEESDIYGDLTMNFLDNTNTHGDIDLSIEGNLYGKALINVKNSTLENLYLAPYNQGSSAQMAIANVEGSAINLLRLGSSGDGTLINGIANIFKGSTIQNLELGAQRNNSNTEYAEANIYGGEVVRLALGSDDVAAPLAHTGTAIVNIFGGKVDDIRILAADSTTINFMEGTKSYITGGIEPGNVNNHVLDSLNLHKHAETHWGTNSNLFLAVARNITLSGKLFYPANEGTIISIVSSNSLTLDGGFVIPENLMPNSNAPVLVFTNGLGRPTLTINKPLTVVLSYSPQLLGANNIPLAFVVPDFYSPNFFEKHNTTGIIWSDSVFDETTGVWSVTNIRPSEDYYGISAAREASNWLRQQHILSVQNRASTTLTFEDKDKSGLWLDVQGGQEKLDTKVGKSKMPWTMATLGYDYLQKFNNDVKALYGINVSFSKGNNKWKSVNTTKNDIIMGIVNAYVGLKHESGIYGTATAQYTASKIKTKSSGFTAANYKWTENIPTEALELGWNFSLAEGLSITPRGQVIFEQLSKHTFKLSQDNDKATLKKSTVITTVAGIHAEYDLVTNSLPISIEAGVDWIQGVSGDFAANSRTLDLTFKDKNDSSVIRTSLSINTQITEDIHCSLSGFIDAGHDKGAGGQLSATYKF